ncbi:MAG: response regulator [Desulfobacterales bacterium]
MDKVLIVDSDIDNLKKIEKGFKELHHFELLTAQTGNAAVDILKKTKITVLITDLNLSDMDGVELLAYMTRNHPSTPCVVMLEQGKPRPWFSDRTGHEDVLYYLEKPFEFGTLASIIFVGLNLKDEGLTLKGMTLKNFLPLIVLGRKTCCMEIISGSQKKGYMYFDTGVLLDAHHNHTTGDQAAKDMAKWESVSSSLFPGFPEQNQAKNQYQAAGNRRRHLERKAKTPSSPRPAASGKTGRHPGESVQTPDRAFPSRQYFTDHQGLSRPGHFKSRGQCAGHGRCRRIRPDRRLFQGTEQPVRQLQQNR